MQKQEFLAIIDKYLSHHATALEEQMLMNFYESYQKTTEWNDELHGSQQEALAEAYNKLQAAMKENSKAVHRVHFLRTAWFRYAAAVIFIIGIGSYFWWGPERSQRISIPTGAERSRITGITSGSNKAILTLASGKKIELNNKTNGQLVPTDGVEITTPRGGQYQLVLPDGSKVWLNAASSIKFSASFSGATRKVEITGETYIEVAPNKSKPFYVISRGMEVQVLGTSFNINAYENEGAVKTTLLDGSVRISSFRRSVATEKSEVILKPGQAYANGKVMNVDVQQAIAWKNGLFNFKDADLPTFARQLERWYDIKVEYEGKPGQYEFQGELHRSLKFPEILEILTEMEVKFRLEGRTLVIIGE